MNIIRRIFPSRTAPIQKSSAFIHREEGAVVPLVAVTLGVLLLITGMAIDLGRMYLVRHKALAALDSALLGAADIATRSRWEDNPEEVRARARQFFRANFPEGYLGTQISDNDIQIEYDTTTGQTTGNVTAQVPYIFGGIYDLFSAGQGQNFSAPVDAQVKRSAGAALEVALVMDYSFSMCFRPFTGRAWGNAPEVEPSCSKFRSLATGVRDFVATIQDSVSTNADEEFKAHFAFVPFTHTNNVNGVTKHENYCDSNNVNRLPMTRGLTSTEDTVNGYLDELFPEGDNPLPSEGGTNSAHGFWWGWAALRNQQDDINQFVGESAHEGGYIPADRLKVEELTVSKVLLLMTDGLNEYPNFRCDAPVGDDALTTNNGGFHPDNTANINLIQMCEKAKAEGIRIITILYNVPEGTDIDNALRTCASEDSSYNAEDTEELLATFEVIARQLVDLRVTR